MGIISIEKKILVVDDKQGLTNMFERALSKTGIQVVVNTSMDINDIDDLFSKNYFHMAFVDIKKADNPHGFKIMKHISREYPKTFLIIFTYYESEYQEEIIKALSFPTYANYVYSKTGISEERIRDHVPEMFDKYIKGNFKIKLEVEDPDALFDFEIDKNKKVNLEEIYNLIGMLFYGNSDIEKLCFKKLTKGKSNTNVFQVIPYVSSDAPEGNTSYREINNVVLKVGPVLDISNESANFDKYVQWYLKETQRVHKINYCESSNKVAGILYTFAGKSAKNIASFGDLFLDKQITTNRVVDIITSIFNPEAQDWFSHRKSEDFISIFGYYSAKFNIKGDLPNRLHDFLQTKRPKNVKLELSECKIYLLLGKDIKLPNPVNYTFDKLFKDKYQSCIIHGDLNSENILLNENYDWILIDYAKTKRGHVFCDFISLETQIRARLLPEDLSIYTLYKLEDGLFNDVDVDFDKSSHYLLERTFKTVKVIRQKALENFSAKGGMSAEPSNNYYIGLLLWCLHSFRHNISSRNKEHILLLAGMACNFIEKNEVANKGKEKRGGSI